MHKRYTKEGKIVDVKGNGIYEGEIVVDHGKITSIREKAVQNTQFILPGLVDAHIHIESSMLIPSEFARLASVHGTVATVSDPHEIANVLGVEGVEFMISNGEIVPFKFFFGAPSCVPATNFESSGAKISLADVQKLLQNDKIKYLSEMMNYPGVLFDDPDVVGKINAALSVNKPVDGHAPGLKGKEAEKYISSGISTDHECFTLEEALEKIRFGMKVQIREGSAAKNFEALSPLIRTHPDHIMFCSDDKHPDDLLKGHINTLIKKAIRSGFDPLTVIRICTLNPVNHYQLDVGLLQPGDPADFIVADTLEDMNVLETYIDGQLVARKGKCLFNSDNNLLPNRFQAKKISIPDIEVDYTGSKIQVIRAMNGQLITNKETETPTVQNNKIISDTERDILKLVVMNRYKITKPACGFIRGFGFKKGAIASTVAHDSHNIIAVGTSDDEIIHAINTLIGSKGGISLVENDSVLHLPLPVAGIMSNEKGEQVATLYTRINEASTKLGGSLDAPFMTLSFMALLVIPELKLSDKGLFDGKSFSFTSLYV